MYLYQTMVNLCLLAFLNFYRRLYKTETFLKYVYVPQTNLNMLNNYSKANWQIGKFRKVPVDFLEIV